MKNITTKTRGNNRTAGSRTVGSRTAGSHVTGSRTADSRTTDSRCENPLSLSDTIANDGDTMRVDNTNSTLLTNPASILLGSFIAVTLISGFILSSSTTKADTNDSVVDDVSITVPVACSMGGTITTGQEHTATLQPGTYSGASGSEYENGIGTTTLTTFCNDFNGFSIYAIGYTGETDGDNTLVGTSTSGNATIPTKVYQSGDITSNWSMKVNKITDSTQSYNPANMSIDNSFDSWHTVPDDYARVAHYKATTEGASSTTDSGTGALGAKVTTTYAAYISATQPADTYTGKVKYVMVHPYMQDDANKPTGSYVMQNISQWKNNLTTGQEVTAIDSRDGKQYTVAKLADGNIWMTQNLDLDLDSTKTYTPQDTDIPANWTPSLSTYAAGDSTWEGAYTTLESYDPGTLYWNGITGYYGSESDCTAAGGTWDSDNYMCNLIASTGDSHYHLGNYYNWTAAVAMNDSSSYEEDGTLVEQSICPAGWTLPRGGSGEDTFAALWDAYGFSESSISGDNKLWTAPLYFTPGGYWDGEVYVGAYGYFWSPVVYYAGGSYRAFFNTDDYVDPRGYDNRYNGYSVRCLAR